MRATRSLLSTGAAVAGALLVAACGASSSPAGHTATRHRTVTVTVTQPTASTPATSTGPLTNTVASGPETTTTAATDTCNASDLSASFLGSNGAAGTIVLGFALKNTGTTTCQTYGWPGVEFLSSSGRPLPTDATRTTADVVGSTPANLLTLNPGAQASFRIVASDIGPGGASCPTASALQIYAPNDTVTMKVPLPGVAACGHATLSPLLPGASAFAVRGGSGGSTTPGTATSGGSGV